MSVALELPKPRDAASLVRSDGRNRELVAFETAVVSFFVDAAEILGIPKSVAAIYGICFASPEALTFSQIQERLDISSGSISQGLRVLREVGALKATVDDVTSAASDPELPREAKRRDTYEPDVELRKLVLHYLEQRVEKQLEGGKKRIRAIKLALPHHATADAKRLAARIRALEGWHTKSRALLPLIKGAFRFT